MIIVDTNYYSYKCVTDVLIKTTLRYIADKPKFKNLSMTFYVRKDADIFMSHGCADKNYREIHKCEHLKKFKLILVPGPFLKRKLIRLGIEESRIACVGWPKLDPLFRQLKRWKPNPNYKTVLWVPTHNKSRYYLDRSISSYPKLKLNYGILRNINGINFKVSVHPKNKYEKRVTLDKLVACDYVIADSGSTVYEAWALGKPVIFPDWIVKDNIINNLPGSAEEYIYSNNIGYHASNIHEMIILLTSNLIIEDDVKEFMEEYLPSKFNGVSGKVVHNEIKKFFIGKKRKRNRNFSLNTKESFNNIVSSDTDNSNMMCSSLILGILTIVLLLFLINRKIRS